MDISDADAQSGTHLEQPAAAGGSAINGPGADQAEDTLRQPSAGQAPPSAVAGGPQHAQVAAAGAHDAAAAAGNNGVPLAVARAETGKVWRSARRAERRDKAPGNMARHNRVVKHAETGTKSDIRSKKYSGTRSSGAYNDKQRR